MKKSFLSKIIPTNLNQEKEKFFQNHKYNPQFKYDENFNTHKLVEYGFPSKEYLEKAQNIVDKAFSNSQTETMLRAQEGKLLKQEQINRKTSEFLKMHNLDKKIFISWSSSYISRASITSDLIKLKIGASFERNQLSSLLFHEIGTHALRRVNYEQQIWYKKRRKYGFNKPYLFTEEGLACLNSLLALNNKLAWFTAVNYLTCNYALAHSFAETWNFVGQYFQDPEKKWTSVLKCKRGMTDTSQPGCHTKLVVYFEGMVQVWNWLKSKNFDPTDLYYGKMHHDEVSMAKKLNPNFEPQMPSFYLVNPEKYKERIYEIGVLNSLF